MVIETEQHITLLRKLVEKYGIQGYGITTRALLDLADQRDELVAALEAALEALFDPTDWERSDAAMERINAVLEKARGD